MFQSLQFGLMNSLLIWNQEPDILVMTMLTKSHLRIYNHNIEQEQYYESFFYSVFTSLDLTGCN